jgi:hypothetical protein
MGGKRKRERKGETGNKKNGESKKNKNEEGLLLQMNERKGKKKKQI